MSDIAALCSLAGEDPAAADMLSNILITHFHCGLFPPSQLDRLLISIAEPARQAVLQETFEIWSAFSFTEKSLPYWEWFLRLKLATPELALRRGAQHCDVALIRWALERVGGDRGQNLQWVIGEIRDYEGILPSTSAGCLQWCADELELEAIQGMGRLAIGEVG